MTGRESYLEARILSSDPLELVCLMYQHAIDAVRDARNHLAGGQIAARSRAISKAIAIVGELNTSLDHNVAGVISRSLEQLYQYMTGRLTEANLRQKDAPLAEVEALLVTLADGWKRIRAPQAPPPAWKESGEALAGQRWSA